MPTRQKKKRIMRHLPKGQDKGAKENLWGNWWGVATKETMDHHDLRKRRGEESEMNRRIDNQSLSGI